MTCIRALAQCFDECGLEPTIYIDDEWDCYVCKAYEKTGIPHSIVVGKRRYKKEIIP